MSEYVPSMAVAMHRVARAIRRHDWREAFNLLEEEGVSREAAVRFVGWERRSTTDARIEAVRVR